MSFLDIFSIKSVDNTVNAIIDTGDAIVYTDEERARAEQLKVDTKLKLLPQFAAFKVAQRVLAFAFTANFILAFWVGVALFFMSKDALLKGFLELVATFQLGWIMLAIVSFYFSGGFIESFKGIKK